MKRTNPASLVCAVSFLMLVAVHVFGVGTVAQDEAASQAVATASPTLYATTPAEGLTPARIIYSHQLYDHGRIDTQALPPTAAVRDAMEGWRHELVILDFEHPNHPIAGNAGLPAMTDAMVEGAQLRVAKIIQSMRRRWPGIRIACYGVPMLLSAGQLDAATADLVRLVDGPLAEEIDVWCISGYHRGDISQCVGWRENITRTVAALEHIDKEILVFVNPHHRGRPDGELIPLDVWRDMLVHLRSTGVGVVLWEHPKAPIEETYIDVLREVLGG